MYYLCAQTQPAETQRPTGNLYKKFIKQQHLQLLEEKKKSQIMQP